MVYLEVLTVKDESDQYLFPITKILEKKSFCDVREKLKNWDYTDLSDGNNIVERYKFHNQLTFLIETESKIQAFNIITYLRPY